MMGTNSSKKSSYGFGAIELKVDLWEIVFVENEGCFAVDLAVNKEDSRMVVNERSTRL